MQLSPNLSTYKLGPIHLQTLYLYVDKFRENSVQYYNNLHSHSTVLRRKLSVSMNKRKIQKLSK